MIGWLKELTSKCVADGEPVEGETGAGHSGRMIRRKVSHCRPSVERLKKVYAIRFTPDVYRSLTLPDDRKTTIASGGRVSSTDCGNPCQGISVASTPPAFPNPLPP